jgi:Ulp1 family protease
MEKGGFNISPSSLEEGYKSVRKWTSKVDLFKKKYIIVPINEQ